MAVLYVPEEVYEQHFEIFAKLVFSTSKQMEKLQIENSSTLDSIDAIFTNRYNLDRF